MPSNYYIIVSLKAGDTQYTFNRLCIADGYQSLTHRTTQHVTRWWIGNALSMDVARLWYGNPVRWPLLVACLENATLLANQRSPLWISTKSSHIVAATFVDLDKEQPLPICVPIQLSLLVQLHSNDVASVVPIFSHFCIICIYYLT